VPETLYLIRYFKGVDRLPVDIPSRVSGKQGASIIQTYECPEFVYFGITEIESLFVASLKRHFDILKSFGEVNDPPSVVAAHGLQDRLQHVVIVEATAVSILNQGLYMNRREVEFEVTPGDSGSTVVYEVVSGDISYNVDITVVSPRRPVLITTADWTLSGLVGPLQPIFSNAGIVIPSNGIRFSGKPTQSPEGDPHNRAWGVTITITGIILPWARMYRKDLPDILNISIVPTVTVA
jgi:hypothetical protein